MPDATRLFTAKELERFPDDDYKYELLEGRLIRMSPTGWEHGRIVTNFMFLLRQHVRSESLGEVVTEVGFTLRSDPDTVRAPDVAFVRRERLPTEKLRGFWSGAPDLAVEVLSPDDRPSEMREKIEEYLGCGVLAVVVIDPDDATATVHRRLTAPVTIGDEGEIDLGDVVDGFRCGAREIFG